MYLMGARERRWERGRAARFARLARPTSTDLERLRPMAAHGPLCVLSPALSTRCVLPMPAPQRIGRSRRSTDANRTAACRDLIVSGGHAGATPAGPMRGRAGGRPGRWAAAQRSS
jgi:hypothetical protein